MDGKPSVFFTLGKRGNGRETKDTFKVPSDFKTLVWKGRPPRLEARKDLIWERNFYWGIYFGTGLGKKGVNSGPKGKFTLNGILRRIFGAEGLWVGKRVRVGLGGLLFPWVSLPKGSFGNQKPIFKHWFLGFKRFLGNKRRELRWGTFFGKPIPQTKVFLKG